MKTKPLGPRHLGKTFYPGRVCIEDVMAWKPCVSREFIEGLSKGRRTVKAMDILKMPIESDDKLWAILRKEFFTHREMVLMSIDFIEPLLQEYLSLFPNSFGPSRTLEFAREWADGQHDRKEQEKQWNICTGRRVHNSLLGHHLHWAAMRLVSPYNERECCYHVHLHVINRYEGLRKRRDVRVEHLEIVKNYLKLQKEKG